MGLYAAALLSAIFAIVCFECRQNDIHSDKLCFYQNIEALADVETTVSLTCNVSSPIIVCSAFCLNCGTLWTVPGVSGQYVKGSDSCVCGSIL